MALLDLYDRKARLTPGLLALVPVSFLIATLGLKKIPVVAIAGAVVVAAGGAYLLAVQVANLGRRAQRSFEEKWSGLPTTQLLRLRTDAENPAQRDIWREAIQSFTGVVFLDELAESVEPRRADNLIKAAVGQILYLGHGDDDHRLVAAENAQFGLERNLYGIRWVGRILALACAAVLYIVLTRPGVSHSAVLSGALADSLWFVGWLLIPSENRTKAAGFRYATQLLNAVVREAKANSQQTGGNVSAGEAS